MIQNSFDDIVINGMLTQSDLGKIYCFILLLLVYTMIINSREGRVSVQ